MKKKVCRLSWFQRWYLKRFKYPYEYKVIGAHRFFRTLTWYNFLSKHRVAVLQWRLDPLHDNHIPRIVVPYDDKTVVISADATIVRLGAEMKTYRMDGHTIYRIE